MKRKNGFRKIQSGYSKELAEEYVETDENFVSCTLYPEPRYEYMDGKYNEDKILSVSYYVYQDLKGFGEDGVQNPFKVKVETNEVKDIPLGTEIKFDNLEAVNIRNKNSSNTYFRAKSIKLVGK